jgi:predicted AAA+ superfamily ATPase
MVDPILLALEQYNPWLVDPGVWPAATSRFLPASALSRFRSLTLDPETVELVVGPRRSGKSTLIRLALQSLPIPPLWIDLDDPALRDLCRSGALFRARTAGLPGPWSALVFDEVQRLDEAGLFLKSLVDLRPGVPIVATGSSSFHLRARTRESLAGRARRTTLLPFSFAEVDSAAKAGIPVHRRPDRRRALLHALLVFGGYPAVWTAPTDRERQVRLLDLVESLVQRDASDAYRVRNPGAFRTIVRLLATQIGSLVNLTEYASLAGVSVATAGDYVEILEESHIVKRVAPFLGGRRAEITSTPKVFFVDNGLRNLLHGGFEAFELRGDRGPLLENFVLTELLKGAAPLDEIRFWRTRNQAEIDFVVVRDDRFVPIEVKASVLRRPVLTRACHSFLQAYRPNRLVVVNLGLEGRSECNGTEVVHCSPEGLSAAVEEGLGPDRS